MVDFMRSPARQGGAEPGKVRLGTARFGKARGRMAISPVNHLVCVDASGFLHRAFHIVPRNMVRSDGVAIGAINLFCSMLWCLVGKFSSASHIAVLGDAGGKTWRHRLDERYKAHRGEKEPELLVQLAMVPDAVAAFGLSYVARLGCEADDLVASLVSKWPGLVTLVASDKDWMQLIDDRIIMFDPMKDAFIRASEVIKKFGVRPDQMTDFLALVGDASDNIEGLPSIGEKTAAALLAAYGSIKGIRGNLDKLNPRQQRLFDEYGEYATQLALAVKLVTLWRDVKGLPDPASFDWQYGTYPVGLAAYCRSNEMESLARRVEEDWHQ